MAEIQFNQLAALITPPPLTDRVLIYKDAAFTAPGSLASLANEAAANNPPNTFTLAELRTLMSPDMATESDAGLVSLATTIEAAAGTDTTKAVTAAGVRAAITAPNNVATTTTRGLVELATVDEAVAGTDTTKAVTPEGALALISASTGGATFVSLTDTPSALGSAGQVPRVNTAGDALEFYSPTTGGGSTTFVGLSDTPASLGTAGQFVAVNTAANALEFVDAPSGGGGATTFTALTDTPSSYAFQEGFFLRVNSTAENLELVPAPSFASLTDTPSSLGTAGQFLAVNSARNALEFVNAPSGGGGGTPETGASIVSKLVALTGNARLPASAINGLPTGISQAQTDKLAGIETGATADQTGAEIVSLLEALSGSARLDYTALDNAPNIPAAQVPADWNAASGVARILNKPTIPAAQVPSDWDATTGVSRILNKPTLVTAFTGLTDTPSAFTGQGGRFLAVNTAANAVEFVDAPSGGGSGGGIGSNLLSSTIALGTVHQPAEQRSADIGFRMTDGTFYIALFLNGGVEESFLFRFSNTYAEIRVEGISGGQNTASAAHIDFRNGTTGNTALWTSAPGGAVNIGDLTEIRRIG